MNTLQDWKSASIERIKDAVCEQARILLGFTVEDEHAEVLCARGYEWVHSHRRTDERKIGRTDSEGRRHKR